MSEMLQIGQHPDADQLSAFMEQALPPQEREATLSHLAVCAECRGVVAMALPPVQLPAAAAAAAPASPGRVWDWLRGWRIGWAAVPALAALVLIGISTRGGFGRREAVSPGQVAELRAPAPAAVASMTPRGDAKEKVARVPGPVAKPVARAVVEVADRSAVASDLPVNGRNLEELKRPPAAATPATAPVAAASAQEFVAAAAPRPVAAMADGAPVKYAAMGEVATGKVAMGELMTDQNAAARAVRAPVVLAALPSGLPLMSVAEHLHQRVALDTKGALFVSEDDGRHWAAVAAKWGGRAVTVAMAAPALPTAVAGFVALDETGYSPRRISAGVFAKAGGMTANADAPKPPPLGTLTGSVTDVTGAAIPRTQVTITGVGGVTRTVMTDESGRYVVADLPSGAYRVRAESPGFATAIVPAGVAASGGTTVNVKLAVGAAAQTVSVEAAGQSVLEPVASPALNAMVVGSEGGSQVGAPVAAPPAGQFPARPQAKAMKARVVASPVFVLTTDAGERWTSSDGASWRRE